MRYAEALLVGLGPMTYFLGTTKKNKLVWPLVSNNDADENS